MTFYLGRGSKLSWRGLSISSKSRSNTSACVEIMDGESPVINPENSVRVAMPAGRTARRSSKKDSGSARSSIAKQKPSEKAPRVWSDISGKYTVEATLAGVKQGKVALRKKDGSTVIVPLKRLVQSDRDYIEKAIKENPDLQFED